MDNMKALILALLLIATNAFAILTPVGGGGGGGAVDSVNGQIGVVTLDTDLIGEGSTNLWFTDGRAQNACWNGFTANKMLVTNASGVQVASGPMSISTDGGGLNAYVTHQLPADAGDVYPAIQRFEAEIDPDGNNTAQSHVNGFATDTHYDRTNSGGDLAGGLSGSSMNLTTEGSGLVTDIWGRIDSMGLGNDTNGGSTTNGTLWNGNIRVGTGHTADNLIAMNIGVSNLGTINDFTLWNVGGAFDATGDVKADGWTMTGTVGGNFTGLNRGMNGNVTGNVQMAQLNFWGDAASYQGLSINAQGNTTAGATGLQVNMNGMLNNGHPAVGIDVTSANIHVSADYAIPSGETIVLGNQFSNVHTVAAATTGTDLIDNIFLSNLIANEDISVGPFGLGALGVGAVHNVAVASGKTADRFVGLAISGQIPSESTGGTLNEYAGIWITGLQSAGGTLSVGDATILSIIDGSCSGATTCKAIDSADANGLNNFAGQVDALKGVRLGTSGSQPTCDSAHRGLMWNIEGGAGVADVLQICQKNAADAYVWVTK